LALAAIFLVCTQGALFGPSKYGLLPELLPADKLSWATGSSNWGRFWDHRGSVCGAVMADLFRGRQLYSGAILFAFTVAASCSAWGSAACQPPTGEKVQRTFLD